MNHVEVPFEANTFKTLIGLFFPISIALCVYLIVYYVTHNLVTFNLYYFLFMLCIFIYYIYISTKSIIFFTQKPPALIFDENKITSGSIWGAYSLDMTLFDNYSFTEVNGKPFVYIHSNNYKKFKKELGLHPIRRFVHPSVKSTGHEGLLISLFTLSTNYEESIDFLNHHLEYKS